MFQPDAKLFPSLLSWLHDDRLRDALQKDEVLSPWNDGGYAARSAPPPQ
jgi:hypothetical protein